MSTKQYDETTGLEAARQPDAVSDTQDEWGEEGIDWEWDTSGGDDYQEVEEDTFDFTALHSCKPKLPHTGYHNAIDSCLEDRFGRLWLFDQHGRRGTQAMFCPFCGFQALDSTAPDKPMQVTPHDIALTPRDKPNAVWVQHRERIVMSHFQFGTVRLLASDGCHAKVLTQDKVQMTVCVENLSPLKGEKMLPKLNDPAKKKATGRKRGEVDPELMKKYLDMGMD